MLKSRLASKRLLVVALAAMLIALVEPPRVSAQSATPMTSKPAISAIDRNVSATARQGVPYEYVRVEHSKGSATLTVLSYGRPLLSGLAALRAEYGWHLDLEQGLCYEPRQTFETTYPENATLQPAPHAINRPPVYVYSVPTESEAGILNKIVSDYNQTGPACQYSIDAETDGTYRVTTTAIRKSDGTYEPFTPLLDTPIDIPGGRDNMEAVARAVSAVRGITVGMNFRSDVVLLGKSFPAFKGSARVLLKQYPKGWDWDLYCSSAPSTSCAVNNAIVWRTMYDGSGNRLDGSSVPITP